MQLHYFDASAVVKYYIREPGTMWMRGLVGEADEGTALISEATITEAAAAFAVLHRVGRISRRARDGAYRAFSKHINVGTWEPVPVLTDDFRFAAELTQRHPLKAYDAVQLAVALRQHRILAEQDFSSTFVSGDATLLEAAQSEGLATDNPFDHVVQDDTE